MSTANRPGAVRHRRRTRDALLEAKVALGPDEIAHRLRRDLRFSAPLARAQSSLSRRRRISSVDVHIPFGTAAGFVAAFDEMTADTTSAGSAISSGTPQPDSRLV
ncbi:hypothetical protein [Gordonia soli]|uniref:hypothetical protein n=1 Tax=Gordonia soli TaxID=320799 RepID=UPI0003464F0B|nr:hypothetical protein [Gordonia soli]